MKTGDSLPNAIKTQESDTNKRILEIQNQLKENKKGREQDNQKILTLIDTIVSLGAPEEKIKALREMMGPKDNSSEADKNEIEYKDPWEEFAKMVPYLRGEGINDLQKLQKKVTWLEEVIELHKKNGLNDPTYIEKLGVLNQVDEFLKQNPSIVIIRNKKEKPENNNPEVTINEEPEVVTAETNPEQVDLKQTESALKKIKNNPAYIKARILELVTANCPTDEAQKIAEYEEMIRMNSERKELLEKGLGLKDREDRIANTQDKISETTLKLNELKSKNNIQEIKVAETQEEQKTQETKIADQKDIEKIILSLENNILEVENLLKTINPEYEDEKVYLQSKLNSLQKKIEVIKEINLDRQEKPFLYYSIEKSNNPLILTDNTNVYGLLDLRLIKNDWRNMQRRYLKETAENEGYFQYDQFGFVKIIKNVNEVRNDKGIDSSSEKAIYKIIGPNGEIIADDIIGYSKEEEIYNQKTSEYEEKIKKEYAENPNASEKVAGLDNLEEQITTELLDLKNRCTEIQVEIEKAQKLEELCQAAEEKRQTEFENGPLSLRMKKNVMNGLSKWENYGQNETGWQGFKHRMTKTTVNLALVGAISLISVDALVKHASVTATALGTGSLTSRFMTRIATGLGLGSAMDLSSKKIPDKVKKWLPIAISTGVAIAFTGFGVVAAAAGASAWAGIEISKKIKGFNTDEKINDKKEIAKQNLFEKYQNEEGLINEDRVADFETEYRKLIIKYENRVIWGKALDEGVKIFAASAISTAATVGAGYSRDYASHHTTTIENMKHEQNQTENNQSETKSENIKSPEQSKDEISNNTNEAKTDSTDEISKDQHHTNETLLKAEDDKVAAAQAAEAEVKHQAEQIKVAMVHKGGSYERSFIHQIEADHKLATDLGYKGDVDNTKALHEFAGKEAHILAIKTGLVGNHGEQSGILEAEKIAPIIKVDNGCVSIEDTALDGKIINVHNEGDTFGQHLSKNEYVIKNHELKVESNQPVVTEQNGPVLNSNLEESQHGNTMNQHISNDEFLIHARAIESDNTTSDSQPNPNESILHPMAAIQAQEKNNIHQNANNPDLPKQNHSNNLDHKSNQNEVSHDKDIKTHDLTHREIRHIERIFNHNIDKIFPNNYNDGAWHKVEDSNAYKLFNSSVKDLSSEGKTLYNYLHKLSDLTGFTPLEEDPSNDLAPETNKHFINDALVTIAKEGKLDDIKL